MSAKNYICNILCRVKRAELHVREEKNVWAYCRVASAASATSVVYSCGASSYKDGRNIRVKSPRARSTTNARRGKKSRQNINAKRTRRVLCWAGIERGRRRSVRKTDQRIEFETLDSVSVVGERGFSRTFLGARKHARTHSGTPHRRTRAPLRGGSEDGRESRANRIYDNTHAHTAHGCERDARSRAWNYYLSRCHGRWSGELFYFIYLFFFHSPSGSSARDSAFFSIARTSYGTVSGLTHTSSSSYGDVTRA